MYWVLFSTVRYWGFFLWHFTIKNYGPNVFIAAILSEITVIAVYQFDIVSFLWLNVIGAAAVIIFSAIGLLFYKQKAVNS
jgi:hypothetical protein